MVECLGHGFECLRRLCVVSLKSKTHLSFKGANSFLYEQFLSVWKISFTTLGDLPWMLLFLLRMCVGCVMGATPMLSTVEYKEQRPIRNIFVIILNLDQWIRCCVKSSIFRGRSRISAKGVHMYKGVGVCLADFISFILNIPWKWNTCNLVSLRPNYFIFIGYLKTGVRERGLSELPEPPLDPPLI